MHHYKDNKLWICSLIGLDNLTNSKLQRNTSFYSSNKIEEFKRFYIN